MMLLSTGMDLLTASIYDLPPSPSSSSLPPEPDALLPRSELISGGYARINPHAATQNLAGGTGRERGCGEWTRTEQAGRF